CEVPFRTRGRKSSAVHLPGMPSVTAAWQAASLCSILDFPAVRNRTRRSADIRSAWVRRLAVTGGEPTPLPRWPHAQSCCAPAGSARERRVTSCPMTPRLSLVLFTLDSLRLALPLDVVERVVPVVAVT